MCKSISWQEITEDAGGIERKVEHHAYPIEHSDTGGRLTLSSLDTEQQVVTATDGGVRRMDGDESKKGPKEGLRPALKNTLLK